MHLEAAITTLMQKNHSRWSSRLEVWTAGAFDFARDAGLPAPRSLLQKVSALSLPAAILVDLLGRVGQLLRLGDMHSVQSVQKRCSPTDTERR
jgi:hypothetical protein